MGIEDLFKRKPETVESLSIKIARKHEVLGRALLSYADFLALSKNTKVGLDAGAAYMHTQEIENLVQDAKIKLPEGYDIESFAVAFHKEAYPEKVA